MVFCTNIEKNYYLTKIELNFLKKYAPILEKDNGLSLMQLERIEIMLHVFVGARYAPSNVMQIIKY
jgi:uncharacterized protein YllA (UPF0747 family)